MRYLWQNYQFVEKKNKIEIDAEICRFLLELSYIRNCVSQKILATFSLRNVVAMEPLR